MVRTSKYPNARDITEILVPEVARQTGLDAGVVQAAADAELYAIAAYSNSGGTVVWSTGRVSAPIVSEFATWVHGEEGNELAVLDLLADGDPLEALIDHLPINIALPRYLPVFDADLEDLAVELAVVRGGPTLDPDLLRTALEHWRLTMHEFTYRAAAGLEDLSDVVIRRLWEAGERDLEDWQMDNLDWGSELRLEVVKRQWRTPDGTIADLLCRISESDIDDFRPGDLIVVENKAGEATPAAIDQLDGYVQHARRQFEADDTNVHGVLVALSIGDQTKAAADAADYLTLNWGEIGYLDHLWAPNSSARPIKEFLNSEPVVERS